MKHNDIPAILARHAAAPAGPMMINRYDCASGAINYQVQQDGHDGEVISNIVDDEVKRARGAARFIVAAWDDVPDMAAEIIALRTALTEALDAIEGGLGPDAPAWAERARELLPPSKDAS